MKDIIIPFAIGITMFLFGLQLVRIGLERLAGDQLQNWLIRYTSTPSKSFLTGTLSTALLQSSSAVTVLTISFVDVGAMSFSQSIGIILGTNVGTTLTTEIMALNIEDFSLPMIIIGLCIHLLPLKKISHSGVVFIGFGCIFLGMEAMQSLAAPLEKRGIFDWMLSNNHYPILTGILIGTVFTALIHSSSATIALTMGLLVSHVITLPIAIAMVFGSNIGTCATAWIATIGTNTAAKQVALAHLFLNIVGVALFVPLIPWISDLAHLLADDVSIQIAHIQTLFNVICSLLVLPFTHTFAKCITWIIPHQTVIPWKQVIHQSQGKSNSL